MECTICTIGKQHKLTTTKRLYKNKRKQRKKGNRGEGTIETQKKEEKTHTKNQK